MISFNDWGFLKEGTKTDLIAPMLFILTLQLVFPVFTSVVYARSEHQLSFHLFPSRDDKTLFDFSVLTRNRFTIFFSD
jgi:hypothetical protein